MAEKRFYVRVRGKVLGPFAVAQLRALRGRGQFHRFHEISEDRQTWRSAATLTEVFPVAGSADASEGNAGQAPVEDRPSTAVEEWIYVTGTGEQHGPVTREQLDALRRAGTIHEATLVWKPGLDQWATLGSLPTLATGTPRVPGSAMLSTEMADAFGAVVGWRRVRSGITLVIVSLFILCAVLVLALFGGLIAVSVRESSALAVTQITLWLIGLIAQVVKTVGFGFCAAAPPQSGARGLGIASFVLAIGDAVVSPAMLILAVIGGGISLAQPAAADAVATARATGALLAGLGMLNLVLAVANPLVFLFFLRAAAVALQAHALAQSYLWLMVLYAATAFLAILLTGVAIAFTGSLQAAGAGVMCVFGSIILLLALAMLSWVMVCLFQHRGVLEQHLARG